ncbi:MAG: FAD-dependent oxidoreductase [Chloroflexi bacterium]|nr:FAD-dependent oxidoreductase [Chloroflexota bacterium]
MRTEAVDVAIVGGGPSGMAAAVAARRAGAEKVVLLERGEQLGGILNQCIHDGFGTKVFEQALTGPEYAQIYIDRMEETGVSYALNTMVLDLSPERELTVCSSQGLRQINAKAVVLCMGCRERTRGAIRIPGHRPAGVYTAGVVQYYMNLRNLAVGRRVVILGSGDVGLIMARRLTLEGAQVLCVAEILPYPSGLARNIVQCLDDFDIPLYLRTTVVEIHGRDRVTGVTLAQIGPHGGIVPGTKRLVECDTLLLSVGLIPENELSKKARVALSPVTGGPVVDDHLQTSVPGVFTAGNALQVHDLVDYACLEAERAGASAARYAMAGRLPAAEIAVRPGQGIRYVVPQLVSGTESVDFSMRVVSPDHDRYVIFRRDGHELRRMKENVLAPASMLRIRVRSDRFQRGAGELTVEVGA